MTNAQVEVELKYRPKTTAAAERILQLPELAGLTATGATRATQLDDRYLDTADGALARAGFAARLRSSAKGAVISVKSTSRRRDPSGAHRREELEGPADRNDRPRDWPASDARSLILELCGDAPLVELVTVRQLRRRRLLKDGGTTLEISLDEVDVVARSQVVDRWVELEVEVVKGDEARLLDVATELERTGDLAPAKTSKLESALAAVRAHVRRHGPLPDVSDEPEPDGESGPAASTRASLRAGRKARPAAAPRATAAEGDDRGDASMPSAARLPKTPGVAADDRVDEAGRKVLRFHLARMLAREAGTRDGSDPEELHAMRVATRRMRAAWRIFGDGFRPARTRRYRRGIRDMARRLGAVRDLDVQIDALERYATDRSEQERQALAPLLDDWREVRTDARDLLIRELDSDRHRRFVEDLRVFAHAESAGVRETVATAPHHVRDTAPSRIWAAYEQVRAFEPVVRWADVETLHDVRIAGKWLRYTLEFVREPLGDDASQLLPPVVALQDHLGSLQDAHVAATMARAFLVEHATDLSAVEAAAIGRYATSREAEVTTLRGAIAQPWGGVSGSAFRRRLGRAVARL